MAIRATINKGDNRAIEAIINAIPFENLDKKALAEIIGATNKAELCFEKLLGVYEQPEFPEICNSRENTPCMFESYDPFREEITYIYSGPVETATCFFLSEEDAQQCHWLEDLYLANGKQRYDEGKTSAYSFEKKLSTEATKEFKGTTHASNWQNGKFSR